jgi:predicted GNAT family N-acyltransferase
VFVEEQGVPEDLEMDGWDDDAVHFVAYDDGPVAAARLREPDPDVGKVERVAVLRERRREGIGRVVMDRVEAVAVDLGLHKLRLHAQTSVESFYRKLGYERTSDVFQEAGIDHVAMEKGL